MDVNMVEESDPPYGSTATLESTSATSNQICVEMELPWWADVIESTELAETLRSQCDEKVLLIDCRSFIEFNQSNIVNSINVCCNKLVKRRLQQDKLKIQDFLSSTCHIEIDSSYTVVVYDQSTTDASTLESDNIVTILGLKCKKAFQRVRVLYGGFLEFQAKHPSLLETKTKTPGQQASASLSQPCMPVTNLGPTKILPYLFLGSMKDALSADLAKANGITYVLNVSMTCPKPPHIQDGHFLRIPVNDNYSEKLLPYFHEAFQFIDKVREANGCVLVHCLAGISRSPTLAIAYIMRSYNMISEDAYRYVKEKRVTISPNFNFLGQLLEYEQQIVRGENGQSLPEAGSKRKCVEDLRVELASPESQSMHRPRLTAKSTKAQSPTSALARLRFEHCMQQVKCASSPTTAFAKLKFAVRADSNSGAIAKDLDYMTCYTADTIHQNTSANSSPCSTPTRSINLHMAASTANSNTNNNNSAVEEQTPNEHSPLPSSCILRPSRPMSLCLTTVDQVNTPTSIKRPLSLGINLLQDPQVTSPTQSQTNPMTLSAVEATPPSEHRDVTMVKANSDRASFRLANDIKSDSQNTDSILQTLNDRKSPSKIRPKSVALPESATSKESVQLPTTSPIGDAYPAHATTANFHSTMQASAKALSATTAGGSLDQQRKCRSLEDMYLPDDSSFQLCRGCRNVATGTIMDTSYCQCLSATATAAPSSSTSSSNLHITQSNTSLSSSKSSHSSLHGSLELVQVS